jgi:hypothetical protein
MSLKKVFIVKEFKSKEQERLDSDMTEEKEILIRDLYSIDRDAYDAWHAILPNSNGYSFSEAFGDYVPVIKDTTWVTKEEVQPGMRLEYAKNGGSRIMNHESIWRLRT